MLTSDGLPLKSNLPLPSSPLTLLSQRLLQEGTVAFPVEKQPASLHLSLPVQGLERALMEKQERLLALAQKASGLAGLLNAVNDWCSQCQRHCQLLHIAGSLLRKNQALYVGKQVKRAEKVLKAVNVYREESGNVVSRLAAEEASLREEPLHPALTLEGRRTIGDLFSMLPLQAYRDKLTAITTHLHDKAEVLQREITAIPANLTEAVPFAPVKFGLETEVQAAERIVASYISFRSALEARKPLEGGLPPLDQFYELISRLESLRPSLDRLREEVKSDCGLAIHSFQTALQSNASVCAAAKTGVKGTAHLLQSLLERAGQILSYLSDCGQMKAAYDATLGEIARRREFVVRSTGLRRELLMEIEAETKLREAYCERFGRIMPRAFLPALCEAPDSIFLYPPRDNDSFLPAISDITPPSLPAQVTSQEIELLKAAEVTYKEEITHLKEDLQTFQQSNAELSQRLIVTEAALDQENTAKTALQDTLAALNLELGQFREYARTLSADLSNLRKVNEEINNEKTMQHKEIVELRARLARALEESSLLESVKLQANAGVAELRDKIEQLRVNNYKLRKKLKTTIHFHDFPAGALALFFPCEGGFAAFHMGAEPVFLNPSVLDEKPELK